MNKNTAQYYKWRKANPEASRQIQKRYAARHKKKLSAYRTAWRLKNLKARLKHERGYRANNRHRINGYMTSRRIALRMACLNLLGGPTCVLCGFSSQIAAQFDFHHIHRHTKSFGVSAAVSRGYTLEQITPEVHKCVILCRNCHCAIGTNNPESRELKERLQRILQSR